MATPSAASHSTSTPYETVRQAVNRLEEAGYVRCDDGLSIVDDRVRDAARGLVAASAGVSPPSIKETYVIPQFGDWPFAFTRIDAVYIWTQGGYQVSRDPDDYPLFIAVREQDGPLQIVLDPHPALERSILPFNYEMIDHSPFHILDSPAAIIDVVHTVMLGQERVREALPSHKLPMLIMNRPIASEAQCTDC